jgi:L-lactate dehydrogenase (cytochrome)
VLARTLVKRKNPHIDNLEPWGGPGLFSREVAGIAAHEALCWRHIRLLRELWKGKLARDCGADGIILSNHGGRQLDQAVSPLQVLTNVQEQAGGLTVMIDSGFRRGTDVIKALALGAHGVFIGRPFLFAAAFAGQSGVAHAIKLLTREIEPRHGYAGRL